MERLDDIRPLVQQMLADAQTALADAADALQPGRAGREQALLEESPPAGYPFGPKYPFGISISGAAVTVYEQVVYRGGVPLTLAQGNVTITTDGDWVALKVTPAATAGEDTLALVRWPEADGVPADKDGFIYRGLHKFHFASGVATWEKAGWVGGDLAMMGY
jgi:hypothetical protein